MTLTHAQFRQRFTARDTSEIATAYTAGSPMLREYLKINGYARITHGRHHLGDDVWQVWMMNGESTGSYTVHRTRADAKRAADALSRHTGLPITRD
jgi:hypothetical protein